MHKKIALALDYSSVDEISNILDKLDPKPAILKIGLQSCTAIGIENLIKFLQKTCPQSDIFLDLKLHDIPSTVKDEILDINFSSYLGYI